VGQNADRFVLKMKTVVAIIQARLGSTRLPNKVLLKIPPDSNITCLGRVIERLKNCTLLDEIILTTPDKELCKIAKSYGIISRRYYGKRDVLREYREVIRDFSDANIIVRITADCPLIDPDIVDQCIDEFLDSNVDLVYNTDESNGQLNGEGSDVEVFSSQALRWTSFEAKTPSDREHITRYMRRTMNTKYVPMKKLGIKSLNTWEDYQDICRIYENEGTHCSSPSRR